MAGFRTVLHVACIMLDIRGVVEDRCCSSRSARHSIRRNNKSHSSRCHIPFHSVHRLACRPFHCGMVLRRQAARLHSAACTGFRKSFHLSHTLDCRFLGSRTPVDVCNTSLCTPNPGNSSHRKVERQRNSSVQPAFRSARLLDCMSGSAVCIFHQSNMRPILGSMAFQNCTPLLHSHICLCMYTSPDRIYLSNTVR